MNPAGEFQLLEKQIEQLRRGEVLAEVDVRHLCEKVGDQESVTGGLVGKKGSREWTAANEEREILCLL